MCTWMMGIYMYTPTRVEVLATYALLDVSIIRVTTCIHQWCVYTCAHTHPCRCACYIRIAGRIYYTSHYIHMSLMYTCSNHMIHTSSNDNDIYVCMYDACMYMYTLQWDLYIIRVTTWVYQRYVNICTHPHVKRCLLRMRCWMYLLYESLHVYMNDV